MAVAAQRNLAKHPEKTLSAYYTGLKHSHTLSNGPRRKC